VLGLHTTVLKECRRFTTVACACLANDVCDQLKLADFITMCFYFVCDSIRRAGRSAAVVQVAAVITESPRNFVIQSMASECRILCKFRNYPRRPLCPTRNTSKL